MIAYEVTCPACGGELTPVALDPQTAPWLCHRCHRGFWAAELSGDARAFYDVGGHHWGWGRGGQLVREAVQKEWLEAHQRRSSLRIDQLSITDTKVLQIIAMRPEVHPDHVAAIIAELALRGVK